MNLQDIIQQNRKGVVVITGASAGVRCACARTLKEGEISSY